MSPKVAFLQQAARQYEELLAAAAADDDDVAALSDELAPLFARIAAGRVEPPVEGLYRPRWHSEDARHGLGTPMFSAEADFLSALEDWRSKSWYPK